MLVCSEPPKVAVTLLAAFTVTAQAAVPVHAPDQPAKMLVVTGVAARETAVPGAKLAEQTVEVAEQLIPAGVLVTVPLPAPDKATVNAMVPMPPLKVAVTFSAALSVRLQVLMPEQPPLHPPKEKLLLGVAVSVSCAPGAKVALHVPGQLIPAGLLVTDPVPLPASATVSATPALNVALTVSAAVIVTTQELVPVQLPLHPPKK